ncbi:ELWxxDGT repeat protein [Flavobacterium sp. LM4]|nr:ELWxxDGT repeat protein [Flavobacterium sp. LM4]OOV17452.1 hypothetical protein BXU10_15255 [Flavobacterium sp. LM4]
MKNKYLFLLLVTALSFGQISQVKDINPGSTNSVANSSSPSTFFDYNGILYFRANNGTDGVELWKSDGTSNGTLMVKNINPVVSTTSNSNPSNFIAFNNQIYFTATTGTTLNGSELWKTDGTELGTVMVKDINPGTANGNPQNFTIINPTTMLFTASGIDPSNKDNDGGNELWTTDGTNVSNVVDYTGTLNTIVWIENLNGTAVLAQTVDQGRELYTSDGTKANTKIIKNINPLTASGVSGTSYIKNGNTIYFQGNDGTTGASLWKTDGTEGGTKAVKDNLGNNVLSPSNFGNSSDNITYFRSTTTTSGVELWKTDGTPEGTSQVTEINPGAGNSNPTQIQSINGVVYFFASVNGTNYHFYKYENNLLTKLYDFNAVLATVSTDYVELNGKIYFAADSDGDTLRELWQTDGTSAGTILVSSLVSGSINPTGVSSLTKVGNKLFFAATGNDGQELFTYTPPTLSVKDQDKLEVVAVYPNPSDGNLFINNSDNETIQYEVFDILGKKQAAGKTNDNSLHLNLKTGLYILKLTKNSQTSTTKIIIK